MRIYSPSRIESAVPSWKRRGAAARPPRCNRTSECGSAVIVVITLLAILLIYVAYNLRTLDLMNRDVKLVEQRQIRRLVHAATKTNSVPKLDFDQLNVQTNATSARPGP